MKICVCIPTRGVIFARTILSSILNPELPKDSIIIIVEGLPIPDAHNECIRRALATDCTHILFVEEDVEIPTHGIQTMIHAGSRGHRYVAIDYLVRKNITTVQYADGKPWYTGFGCTLFDRKLFEKEFTDPWLTDQYDVMIIKERPLQYKIQKRSQKDKDTYGKYDVYFGTMCKEKGIAISVIPDMICQHLRVSQWERKEVNEGTFDIYTV